MTMQQAISVGEAVLLHEFRDALMATDGRAYVVRVFGQPRADGTWVGWLTFVDPERGTVRRTPRETTQSNREQAAYWATGLGQSYLEGAFRRATWRGALGGMPSCRLA